MGPCHSAALTRSFDTRREMMNTRSRKQRPTPPAAGRTSSSPARRELFELPDRSSAQVSCSACPRTTPKALAAASACHQYLSIPRVARRLWPHASLPDACPRRIPPSVPTLRSLPDSRLHYRRRAKLKAPVQESRSAAAAGRCARRGGRRSARSMPPPSITTTAASRTPRPASPTAAPQLQLLQLWW